MGRNAPSLGSGCRGAEAVAESFAQRIEDQKTQVESLKSALRKLEQKLAEAEAKAELLVAQHRRTRAAGKAADAQAAMGDRAKLATFDRMKNKVERSEAVGQAKTALAGEDIDDRFAKLEKEEEIERMLAEIKQRRGTA
jgi:phage shock protein A